jgi:rhodanese-related sulfurtransferase
MEIAVQGSVPVRRVQLFQTIELDLTQLIDRLNLTLPQRLEDRTVCRSPIGVPDPPCDLLIRVTLDRQLHRPSALLAGLRQRLHRPPPCSHFSSQGLSSQVSMITELVTDWSRTIQHRARCTGTAKADYPCRGGQTGTKRYQSSLSGRGSSRLLISGFGVRVPDGVPPSPASSQVTALSGAHRAPENQSGHNAQVPESDHPPSQRLSVDQLLVEARSRLARLGPHEAHRAQQQGAVLVDIRPEANRVAEGRLPGALVIERTVLEWRLDPTSVARLPCASYDLDVVLVCNEGYSSSLAAATLQDLGMHRATDLDGGYRAWRAAGLRTE